LTNYIMIGNLLEEFVMNKSNSELKEKYPCIISSVKDSRWICDIIPPSPVDDNAFASMGVQYLAASVEIQPVTFL